jgi:hypothetical protein
MTDAGSWIPTAVETLATLGFTLVNSDRPTAEGGPQLLVALRDAPTLRHFDPENVTCWVAEAGRGRPLTIDRATAAGDREIEWGHIHVTDRLGVENRFLTFGGALRVADVATDLRVVQHLSPGPIVRWGGHSQGTDALAGEIGAFFGRLIVPVDYLPGGEARIAAEEPSCIYAAFLMDRTAHDGRVGASDDRDPLIGWLHAEATRVRTREAACWAAGERLLRDLGLAT